MCTIFAADAPLLSLSVRKAMQTGAGLRLRRGTGLSTFSR